jgi:predicted amidohydrolase
MKICVAQTRPVRGDINRNIENHKKLIDIAVSNAADIIIFPELSLTGYEPQLANELAVDLNDSRFDDFQQLSDKKEITIGLGVPARMSSGVSITMILFRPQTSRQWYAKKYLHADEEEFFCSGESSIKLIGSDNNIALAICYELSVTEHAENAFANGAEFYIASVAKTCTGVQKAIEGLTDIARKYSMTVLMSNCIGLCDGMECGGRSSIWNNSGLLLNQLDDTNEGILIINTETGTTIKHTL